MEARVFTVQIFVLEQFLVFLLFTKTSVEFIIVIFFFPFRICKSERTINQQPGRRNFYLTCQLKTVLDHQRRVVFFKTSLLLLRATIQLTRKGFSLYTVFSFLKASLLVWLIEFYKLSLLLGI